MLFMVGKWTYLMGGGGERNKAQYAGGGGGGYLNESRLSYFLKS